MKKYLFLAALFVAQTASADVVNEALRDTSRVVDLDEVVVVTQPKENYRLRQQPLSSSMYSFDDMQTLGIRDLRELSSYIPSFVMPDYGSRYTSSVYVRGIGSRVNSPIIGMYIDGIPLVSKSQMNFHTYQLERIDILRGPQGTLYGMNTEGGLVRMYSRNPLTYQGTDVKLGIGSRFYRNVEAAHYHRFSSQLAMSVAGFYQGQNGFFRNTTTGRHADRYDEAGGKVRLLYLPTDRLTFDFIADYQYVNQKGFPYGVMDPESGKTANPESNRMGTYRRNMLNTGVNIKYVANGFDLHSTTSYQFLRDKMGMDIDYTAADRMFMQQKQLQNAITEEISLKSNTKSRWQWTTGVFTSYQWLRTDAPVYFYKAMSDAISQQIYNTIYQAAYNGQYNAMYEAFIRRGMSEAQAAAQAEAVTKQSLEPFRFNITMDEEIPGTFHTPQFNLGLFHESNISLTDRLVATLGLRYDLSHVRMKYETRSGAHLDINTTDAQSRQYHEITAYVTSTLQDKLKNTYNQLLPKVGLRYTFDDYGSNVYAVFSKGYQAGGFNIQQFSDILQSELQGAARNARADMVIPHDEATLSQIADKVSFKPETSWNYELGTHLNLFDNRLQWDLSGFYMQVRNQQLDVMASTYGYGRMMVNAGKSFSCGVETQLRGSLLDNHLSYTLGYSYTHAQFKEYDDMIDANTKVSYKDKRVPFVPAHKMNIALDYRFDLTGNFLKSLTIGANTYGQGKIYWDAANTAKQKFYAVAGAHAALEADGVTFNLWARNITNTGYNVFALYNTSSRRYIAQRGNPFQMGFDVNIHF